MGKRSKSAPVSATVLTAAADGTLYGHAAMAFDTYYTETSARFGMGYPRFRQKHMAVFDKIAVLCFNEGWDAADYVRNGLNFITKNHRLITPRDLLADTVIGQYRTNLIQSTLDYNPECEWKALIVNLISYMTTSKSSEAAILECPMTPFPSWFRLLYPETLTPAMVECFGENGRKELMRDKRLRGFLRMKVPKAFAVLEREIGRFGDMEVPSGNTDVHA